MWFVYILLCFVFVIFLPSPSLPYIDMEKRITDISGYSKFNLVQKSDSGCADSGNPYLFFLPVILFLHVMQVHS